MLENQRTGYNRRDTPPNVSNLTLKAGNGTIAVTFKGVSSLYLPTVVYYVATASYERVPWSPSDGQSVIIPPGTVGDATLMGVISGLSNGALYHVRVFAKCTNGAWQSSMDAVAIAMPIAGIEISTLPSSGTPGKVKIDINGTSYNFSKVHQGLPSSMYDASCDGAWMLMEAIYENRQWHSSNVNDYANSTIKAYLDNTFLHLISANVRDHIKQVKIPYRPGSGTGMGVNSGVNGLSCKIFLLSGYEVGWTNADSSYFPPDGTKLSYFEAGTSTSADNKRIAYFNGSVSKWWTRTPNISGSTDTRSVWIDGGFATMLSSDAWGTRPAFVLPSNFLLNPTPNPDGSYSPLAA